MISLMLSLFMLLPTSIIANSTTQNCRRSPFFNRLRKEKWGPQKTNHSDRFLQVRVQARVHQYLTPKEQFFDMPSFLKYGSTGRPPGKFHIRHSPKKITENLESPSPPFDIFSIEKINSNNNNNNNIICYYDNGGIICNKGVLVDSKAGAGAGAGSVAGAGDDANVDVHINDAVALMNQIEPNRYKYNNNNNNKSISPSITNNTNTTTSITTSTTTSTNNDDETSHLSFIIKLLSERLADRLESNRCKYKFNIDGISTTTTTTTTAPATGTINYKTSTEGTSNEDGEEAEAPGVSERLADRFESNRSNHNYKYKSKFNIDGILTTTTTAATTTATINYKTSAEGNSHEDGEDAEAPGVSERLADRFESNRSNHNYKYKSKFNIDGISTTTTTTTSTNNDDETSHLSLIIKLLSLCLIITKSFSSTTKEPKEKHHHQQQQEHYHAKDRHQFHLEQQQKHQYFKQQHHNVERKAASIVLKLTLVAWDMWTYRNGF